jgi:acyl-CoA hydrolase
MADQGDTIILATWIFALGTTSMSMGLCWLTHRMHTGMLAKVMINLGAAGASAGALMWAAKVAPGLAG